MLIRIVLNFNGKLPSKFVPNSTRQIEKILSEEIAERIAIEIDIYFNLISGNWWRQLQN